MEAGMQLGAAPLLERHRIFHSHNAEETRAYLRQQGVPVRSFPRRPGNSTRASTPSTCQACRFGYFHYGAAGWTFSVGARRLLDPVAGSRANWGGWFREKCRLRYPSRAVISRRRAAVPVGVERGQRSPVNCRWGKSARAACLAARRTADGAGRIRAGDGCDDRCGRSLARHVLMAMADLEQAGLDAATPSR